MSWPIALAYITSIVFDILIFGGTGYAVFVLGASGWWFLLALLISAGNSPSLHSDKRYLKDDAS